MASSHLMHSKIQDPNQRRSIYNQSLSKSNNELYAYLYVNKFNTVLQKMHDTEYKTKNSNLFTWRQTQFPQNKLKSPPSIKKKVSQMSINLKEVIHTTGETDPYLFTSPGDVQHTNTKEQTVESIQVIKSQKKTPEDTQKDFYSTNSIFKTQPKIELGIRREGSLSISNREKKVYSVVKAQMGLLTCPGSPLLQKIPNVQHMPNQFDRKNYTVNRIISQISTHDDLIDKEEVKTETLQKMQYIVKDIKLNKMLKPKTASHSTGKRITVIESKSPKATEHELLIPPEINIVKAPRMRSFKMPRESQDIEGLNTLGLPLANRSGRPSVFNKEEDLAPFKLKDKIELTNVMKRMKRKSQPEKSDPKDFLQNLGTALRDIETPRDQGMKSQHGNRDRKSCGFLVRVNTKEDVYNDPGMHFERVEENVRENNFFTPQGTSRLGDDNIFNFGKYFKKRYMEKGTPFEMSKDLKSRINNFEKQISESVRRVQTADVRDKEVR